MKEFDTKLNTPDDDYFDKSLEHRKVILVCDDSTFSLHAMKRALRNYYHVICASSGYEAVSFASLYNPDIIILDIVMYGMDGFEALRKLKSMQLTQEIPVMFLTGIDTPEARAKADELCACAYLIKPFNLNDLLVIIEKYAKTKDMCYERIIQQSI